MYMLWIFIGIVVISIPIAIIQRQAEKKNAEKVYQLEQELKSSYFYYNRELTLYKQDARLKDLLVMSPYTATTHEDVPEQYVYTGATVGGVTTGGVHKTGGYTETTSHSTRRWELKIKDYNYDKESVRLLPVEKIYIPKDNLLEIAQKHSVKQYIDGQYIIVKEEDQIPNVAGQMWRAGMQTDALNALTAYNVGTYPTYEKCKEILSFIYGTDDGNINAPKTELTITSKIMLSLFTAALMALIFGVIGLVISLLIVGSIYWPVVWGLMGFIGVVFFIFSLFTYGKM